MEVCTPGSAADRGRRRRFTLALLAWALVYVASTAASTRWPELDVALALAPTALGLFAALQYRSYVVAADELVRTVELTALAWTVAAGFVAFPLGQALSRAGLEVLAELPTLAMAGAYSVSNVLMWRRYR